MKSRVKKPLSGVNIVVTRARDQASGFAQRLRAGGARVLVCPTIRIVPPRSFARMDRAVRNLPRYDWLVFTSVNGVEMFAQRLRKLKVRVPRGTKTCAIGPATADRMRRFQIPVGKVSKEYVAESVLDALKVVRGKRVLIPRAAVARDVLPVTLRKRGAWVDVVRAYRTRPDSSGIAQFKKWLSASKVDCVTFTSSSTVNNFFSLLNAKLSRKLIRDARVRAASIGPVTSATLRKRGWPPAIIAAKPTTAHLSAAIQRFFKKELL